MPDNLGEEIVPDLPRAKTQKQEWPGNRGPWDKETQIKYKSTWGMLDLDQKLSCDGVSICMPQDRNVKCLSNIQSSKTCVTLQPAGQLVRHHSECTILQKKTYGLMLIYSFFLFFL